VAATIVVFRETPPPERRVTGELTRMVRDLRRLLTDRVFLGVVLVSGLVSAALFAYLAGASRIRSARTQGR
jgi:DHA1 family bicyclomycin/chloramphenicol resistance-like MFS transporter